MLFYTQYVTSLTLACFEELVGIPRSAFCEFVEAYENYKDTLSKRPGPLPKYQPADKMLVLFVYLHHYPVDVLLGAIFGMSKGHAHKIRKEMLDWFYDTYKHELTFKTVDNRLHHTHKYFHTRVTFGIDGSEQPMCADSDNSITNIRFYSKKKDRHTINIIVIVDMGEKVLFIGKAYTGNKNDNVIIANSQNEWLDLLEQWEHGVGDSGFRKSNKRTSTSC